MRHEQAAHSQVTPVTLKDLILPGTPDSVARAYASLSERAARTSFGLLEEDLIVLDTETTGLSFKDCTLIEISAARISGGKPVARYETFVDPGRPIPPEIVALTGITSLDVAGAPTAEEAVRGLAEFAGGMPVLAHNATFDRTFVEKVKGGREVSDVWIDTLALSRIALPRLRSHSLSDMAAAFGCDSVTHRAGDDVDALCGMWRIILMALSDLPRGLVGLFAGMHTEVEWPYRAIFSHLALEDPSASFSLKSVRKDLVGQSQPAEHADARERMAPFDVPTRTEIAELFGRGGLVDGMYERFEPRPEQVAMATEVRDALATSTHRAIEAGTGVGKSMAYLLPEVLFAKQNNLTVGIATKTNALTDQLVSHELPLLDKALPGGVSFYSNVDGDCEGIAWLEHDEAVGDGKWLDGELPEEQRGSDGYLAAHPEWERYDFISEGDSPSFLYLVDKGLRSLEDPTFGGWGGRFSADGRNMVADYDPWSGRFEASHTLTRWLDDLQGDFAARLQWCTASRYEEANHAPELRVIEGYDMLAQPGERGRWMPHELEDVMVADMVLDRTASPAKGKEPWVLQLTGADQRAVSFVVPPDARPGDTFHIIAEATDDAPQPMKAYRRVIVTVR